MCRSSWPSREVRPPVRSIHIHKAGGTTFHVLSKRHGEVKVDSGVKGDCEIDFSNPCDTIERTRFGKEPMTFASCELAVEIPLCPYALYHAVFREPVQRVISHALFSKADMDLYYNEVLWHGNIDFSGKSELGYHIDNQDHQVKMLVSANQFDRMFNAINEVHLERAKALVRRMCLVSTLENLDRNMWNHFSVFAWDFAALEEEEKKKVRVHSVPAQMVGDRREFLHAIEEQVRFDTMLYRYVQSICV